MKQFKDIIGTSIDEAHTRLCELGFLLYARTSTYYKDDLKISLVGFFANLWKSHKQKQPLLVDMIVLKADRAPDFIIRPSLEEHKHHFLISLPESQTQVDMQEVVKTLARQ